MGVTMKDKKKDYQYSCPFCGASYKHSESYIHSVAQCQKNEKKGPKVGA